MFRTWISFLKAEGYDIDNKEYLSDTTPLLSHLSHISGQCLAIARLLLEFGANAHETDSHGCNAIQCAMLSNIDECLSEFPELLEEKLSLLIEVGADIHHRDKYGITPSEGALIVYNCWNIWCRALERNGLNISEVIDAEGSSWLVEEFIFGESDVESSYVDTRDAPDETDTEELNAEESDVEESNNN